VMQSMTKPEKDEHMTRLKSLLLAAFMTFTWCAGQAIAATATLTWTAPTIRTDGSPITGALTTQIWDAVAGTPAVQIGTGASPFTTPMLDVGGHSFSVIVCEAGGQCSAPSNMAAVMIAPAPPAPPSAVSDLTANVNQ
jgi:hypothetical protein